MTSPTIQNIDEIAELLKVLGHPVRLKLIDILAAQEYAVGSIETLSEIRQPALSQQLAILRKAELVVTRREAKRIYYRVNQQRIKEVCNALGWMHSAGDTNKLLLDAEERRRKLGSGASFARLL